MPVSDACISGSHISGSMGPLGTRRRAYWTRKVPAQPSGQANSPLHDALAQAQEPAPEVLLTGLSFPLTILLDMQARPQFAGFFRPDHDPPPIWTMLLI